MHPQDPIPFGLCQCGCGQKARVATSTSRRDGQVKGQPLRFVKGHNGRRHGPEYVIVDRGYRTPCWEWQGERTPDGYPRIWIDNQRHEAHRVYFERHVGTIPDGLQLDHLCRNPPCVNPGHLEPVTIGENVRRGRSTKLTPSTAAAIRSLKGKHPQHVIGAMFGVSQPTVSYVLSGKRWPNTDDPANRPARG